MDAASIPEGIHMLQAANDQYNLPDTPLNDVLVLRSGLEPWRTLACGFAIAVLYQRLCPRSSGPSALCETAASKIELAATPHLTQIQSFIYKSLTGSH